MPMKFPLALLVVLAVWSCAPTRAARCLVADLGSSMFRPATSCGMVPIVPAEIGPADRFAPVATAVRRLLDRPGACGSVGCSSRQLTVIGDAFPVASVEARGQELAFTISTGMVELVERTAIATLAEVGATSEAPADGLGAWFELMNSNGGAACIAPSQSSAIPMRPLSINELGFSDVVFTFLFAHELAHVTRGQDCGARSVDALEIEHACDVVGYEELRNRGIGPIPVILWLVIMHHHEQALSTDVMRASGAAGKSYMELYPARDWTRRARALLSAWQDRCSTGADRRGCTEVWKGDAQTAEMVLSIPRPLPCSPSAPMTSPIVDSAAAHACLDLGEHGPANYNKNGRPNLVSMDLDYRNSCSRALRCELTLASGTVRRDRADEEWEPYVSTKRTLYLEPGETKRVTALLRWRATAERMPSVRRPDADDDVSFARCELVGLEKVKTPLPKECERLTSYLEAATNEFASLPKLALEGTSDCEVSPADWVSEASFRCTVLETESEDALNATYARWVDLARRCMPPPLWRSDEHRGSTGWTVYQEMTFARSEASVQVEITRSLSTTRDPHNVSFEIRAPKRAAAARPPAPGWSNMPRETVTDLGAAVDRMLALLETPERLQHGVRIQIEKRAGGRRRDENDNCFFPSAKLVSPGRRCMLVWRCETRNYYKRTERNVRFHELVKNFTDKFQSMPKWTPHNSDSATDWLPYVQGDSGGWVVQRPDEMSVSLEMRSYSDVTRSIDISVRGRVPSELEICKGAKEEP